MEVLKTITKYYIAPKESGQHVDASKMYWLFTQVDDAPFTEEQLEILEEYNATGMAEVQTTVNRTVYVKGDIIMEVTSITRVVPYESIENPIHLHNYRKKTGYYERFK